MEFFLEKEKKILIFVFLFVRNHKRTWIAKTIQRKQNKARGIKHYKTIVMINSMILVLKQLLRSLKQISPEISPHIHVQVAFDKEIKEHSMRISSTNGIENKR